MLALFPHRFDFIHAEHPEPSQSPHWQTESRYPLSDRLILAGAALYGVRLGSQTRYCLLDIDAGSLYHPQSDPFAIGRMIAVLEPIGFTTYLPCQSSYRGGIHLYLPFQESQNSWELAACVTVLLENAGFKLNPGQLELFPNPKPYSLTGKPALFNAHRLPMQAGFYLLNRDFQPIWGDRSTFVKHWHFAASRNLVCAKAIRQLLKQHRRKHYRISGKADKFLNDLDTEIEQGWTGYGQTNRLLGRIALRTYIFHHVLQGGEPLTGPALADQIAAVARSLPGYRDWCRHQHEIEQRAAEWARCVESSHYFHYTHRSAVQTLTPVVGAAIDSLPSWNQQQAETTRERIRSAIADLLEKNCLPAKTTARFQALLQYGIGGGSLYRHRDLWHPDLLKTEEGLQNAAQSLSVQPSSFQAAELPVENLPAVEPPPHPPTSLSARQSDQLEAGSNCLSCTSLFPGNGGNVFPNQTSGDRLIPQPIDRTRQIERSHQLRIQQYLNSADPILIAEAKAHQRYKQHESEQNKSKQHEGNPALSVQSAQNAGKTKPRLPVSLDFSVRSLADCSIEDLIDCSTNRFTEARPTDRSADYLPEKQFQYSQKDSLQDLSDLLVAISVEVRRLRWTHQQIRDRLLERYGKTSRAMLAESELFDWLTWLKTHGFDDPPEETPSHHSDLP